MTLTQYWWNRTEWAKALPNACDEALLWLAEFDDPNEAWQACQRGDWMVWLLDESGMDYFLRRDVEGFEVSQGFLLGYDHSIVWRDYGSLQTRRWTVDEFRAQVFPEWPI